MLIGLRTLFADFFYAQKDLKFEFDIFGILKIWNS
jgi:hypothetical protein